MALRTQLLKLSELNESILTSEQLDSGKMIHRMEENGMMFLNYKDEICFCSHRKSMHIDASDICLVANPICICSEFKNQQTIAISASAYEDQSKIVGRRKKQPEIKENVIPAEGHIFDYIQTLSKI